MRKKFLVLLFAVVFIAPIVLFAATSPAKDVTIKKVGTSKSAVVFSHEKHAKNGATDCDGCHKAAKSKDDAHKYCKDCHQAKTGPKGCSCHK